jgi:PII-like signaling protein
MTLTGTALRMTVFISEDDQFHHRPLYTEIVHRAHAAGLAGATVLRGHEGFGASSHIHTTRILSLSDDLPALILIVDRPDKIREFLPQVEELVTKGLIILDEVEVVRYVGSSDTEADVGRQTLADVEPGDTAEMPLPRVRGWRAGRERR